MKGLNLDCCCIPPPIFFVPSASWLKPPNQAENPSNNVNDLQRAQRPSRSEQYIQVKAAVLHSKACAAVLQIMNWALGGGVAAYWAVNALLPRFPTPPAVTPPPFHGRGCICSVYILVLAAKWLQHGCQYGIEKERVRLEARFRECVKIGLGVSLLSERRQFHSPGSGTGLYLHVAESGWMPAWGQKGGRKWRHGEGEQMISHTLTVNMQKKWSAWKELKFLWMN